MDISRIRNFSIIAHIDHGKSTIADRILEITNTIPKRKMREQLLDDMELERERGITIKAKAVRINYSHSDGQEYILDLIDTPGHVDFSYEVSRALAACEGVLLVVDASQGIEAQTFANMQLAEQANLVIIPVINKIDLPNADVKGTINQLNDNFVFGMEPVLVSGKTGQGVPEILDAIIKYIPAPNGDESKPLSAFIIDSVFDPYKGVIVYVRMIDGIMKTGMKIQMFASKDLFEVTEIGHLRPKMEKSDLLRAGEVGYITAGIKDIHKVKIGDTIIDYTNPVSTPHPGYKEIKPFVFVGLYPIVTNDYELLKLALEKLRLNDSSFFYLPETSKALGFGFRCGFLGLLHMDIIKERLEREYNLQLLITAPNVEYNIIFENGASKKIDNPAHLPDTQVVKEIQEPYLKATLILPSDMVGGVMQICQNKRGKFINMKYLGTKKVILVYEMPLAEILYDFYDQLKSVSKGHASFDYELMGYQTSELVKLEILINNEEIDALAFMTHKDNAVYQGRRLIEKLREIIPRQMFQVPLQAKVNGKIIVRENVTAIRKDVLSKCYGGDITRKRKLLEKQKEGKKKMKQFGKVSIPQEAFSAVLGLNKEDDKK
jgi:GTP-binding protein LepA